MTATFDTETFYTLVNEYESEELVELVAGGQLGEYPMNFCVDQHLMLSAVKEFFISGKIDDTADWLGE
ncbi:Imm1 family immunity protein [Paenibacillus sp. Soil522]|uniref:Imm1 family immunity protein n=1 Tax=Paenibacillus sp. Soil522 TaxID=1736388 RepID=UPI0006F73239|nr:Imm1 family immunity protein [Paenibacillus sp. Soil522]KRE36781.1 hypothetical protein ASG81_20335 [Paenibacillus sp. Soil522]